MSYKIVERELPWTRKTKWKWPEVDRKLLAVFEQVADIEVILPYVADRSVCIQAGGACGVWALRFAQEFEQVFTFEPLAVNFECLVHNTKGVDNIVATHAPLTNDHERYSIHNDAFERENLGAGYIVPDSGGVQATTIDDLSLEACGLIQLDVEGSELAALQGGAETIEAHKPVIVLEEKRLNHVGGDPAKARKWLESEFGYQQVGSVHRDVILAV